MQIIQVDADARRDTFAHDPGLRSLVRAVMLPIEEDLDAPTPPATPPPESEASQAAHEDDDFHLPSKPGGDLWVIDMEAGHDPSTPRDNLTTGELCSPHGVQGLGKQDESAFKLRGDLLDIDKEMYTTQWRRKCAMDTLCSMLVRDVDGR